MTDLDGGAVARGAVPGTILAFACIVLRTVFDAGALAGLFFLLALVAFGVAGGLAAAASTDRPVVHGGCAALVASVVVGLVGVPIRLSRHPEATAAGQLLALPLFCLIAMSCGIAGAYAAGAVATRSAERGGNPS